MDELKIIAVDQSNIDQEHICCAITDKKGETCVSSKKAWMQERFPDGLVFRKLNVRGKVFIEYIPAEHAWIPILAEQYMHINCLWVSGKYKGQGYSDQLLNQCIDDAKKAGKSGLTALSSAKKKPFLSDPGYLKHRGLRLPIPQIRFTSCYIFRSPMTHRSRHSKTVSNRREFRRMEWLFITAVSVRTLQNMSLCFKNRREPQPAPLRPQNSNNGAGTKCSCSVYCFQPVLSGPFYYK